MRLGAGDLIAGVFLAIVTVSLIGAAGCESSDGFEDEPLEGGRWHLAILRPEILSAGAVDVGAARNAAREERRDR